YGEHQPAVGRGGVCPSVLQAAEASFPVANGGEHVEQVAGGACEPVQARDYQHITRLEPVNNFGQLSTVGFCTRYFFLEYLRATGRRQLSLLGCEVLAIRTDACISVSYHFLILFVRHYTKYANQMTSE